MNASPSLPAPPDWLSDEAKAQYRRLVVSIPSQHWHRVNPTTLARYALLFSDCLDISRDGMAVPPVARSALGCGAIALGLDIEDEARAFKDGVERAAP